MRTLEKITALKAAGEDREWYPTTDEIFAAISADICALATHKESPIASHRYRGEGITVSREWDQNDVADHTVGIGKTLDIGAGDGRAFDKIAGVGKVSIKHHERLGVEIARVQADDLIRRGVALIGRDFHETVFIDKSFDLVFCNPPYSEYDVWAAKIAHEVNAMLIYLVLPYRWGTNTALAEQLRCKGDLEVIGSFDFTAADREARAKVDVIRITRADHSEESDTFYRWVEENIGLFEANEQPDVFTDEKGKTPDCRKVERREGFTTERMVENYNRDLAHLVDLYHKLGEVDFAIIKQLGVEKKNVIARIRSDIKALKERYWRETFDALKEISDRLTNKTRKELLTEIRWFEGLDYNVNNVYTVVIWVIENFNEYTQAQMLECYDNLTDFDAVRAYKSNDKWIKDGWRYTKERPEKYALDYRIVARAHISKYGYEQDDNLIKDLSVVAYSLGFPNHGVYEYELQNAHECLTLDGSTLFNYRIYQNGNVHFRLSKELIKRLNIEVGKLRGWLRSPDDIASEFDLSADEAARHFAHGSLTLLDTTNTKLLA